jgi:hypothetical protein
MYGFLVLYLIVLVAAEAVLVVGLGKLLWKIWL